MKESKDTKHRSSSVLAASSGWQHRGSVSSHRSVRSTQSQDSVKSKKSRRRRPRRLSLSSVHSQAVSLNSTSSVETNAVSRKTSHADDSDASDTNESLGETEEDVWFPTDARDNGDINVEELDQLLNLSDDDDDVNNELETSYKSPRTSTTTTSAGVGVSAGSARDAHESGSSYNHDLRDSDTLQSPTRRGRSSQSKPHQIARASPYILDEQQSEALPRHHSNQRRKSTASTRSSMGTTRNDAESATISPRTKFVEYRPAERFDPKILSASDVTFQHSSLQDGEYQAPQEEEEEEDYIHNSFQPEPRLENKSSGSNSGSSEEPKGDLYQEETRPLPSVASPILRPASVRKRPSESHFPNSHSADTQQSQRYSFFAPGLENTVHAPDLASLVGEHNSFSSLFNPDNGTWFLDCFRPTDVEMKALSRAFGIHPLTTEDIQIEDSREKFESFKNYYLVAYHTFENDKDDENYMKVINFYILVFKEGVISFHFEPVSHCRNVRRRMRQLRDYLSFTSDWIAYALIDDITDSFAPEIHSVEQEADFIEDAVYLDHDGEIEMHTLLRRLGEGRRHTMHLLRMLSGKADVVRGFAKRVNERDMPTEMNLYLGDIQDHIVTMYQNLSAYEKIFSRTHFNYMGLLQMEFVDSSNRMTGVLGKVTILGTVLVPMNLITGLFGMNVKVPGQDVENLRWFFGILGLVLFLITVLLLGSGLYVKFSINRRNPPRTQ